MRGRAVGGNLNGGDLWAREIIFCVVRTPKADGSGQQAAHRRCTIRCSLPWEQERRRVVPSPANPLLSGKHGRPRCVADRAASRG